MMDYSNSEVRRQDRLLDQIAATQLLSQGEYGVLSMYCNEHGVYGVPLNYAWDGNSAIYVHCAQQGQKLKCIDNNNAVSFCVVGKTNVISEKFTTEYESIVLNCRATRTLNESERMNALVLIVEKYSPGDKEVGIKYAQKSFDRTEIIRLDIEKWSGKCKKIHQ
ncbi:MAG TPA: pyridoxamine 5'-phosphate oxidase family protein [Prolixibacteraceae bacterium]|nr:pyridoxamine 5'-phosphate oxidase family protein [Prolixibacteraceae bacterium]